MKESDLRDGVTRMVARMRAAGDPVMCLKLHGSAMHRGEPDLLIAVNGQCCFVELKVGKNKLTKLQAVRMDQWRRAGMACHVARSVLEVWTLIVGELETGTWCCPPAGELETGGCNVEKESRGRGPRSAGRAARSAAGR